MGLQNLTASVTCRVVFGPTDSWDDGFLRAETAMKTARLSEEQVARILREADAGTVAETTKKHSISEQTRYLWCKRFGQLAALDV